jgi:hypothetical protein
VPEGARTTFPINPSREPPAMIVSVKSDWVNIPIVEIEISVPLW